MTTQNCILIGAPMDCGKRRTGCLMGPDAYRTADLAGTLQSLGHDVQDRGNVTPAPVEPIPHDRLHKLAETIAWTKALADASEAALRDGFPIFMGGDHALALGTVLGATRHAAAQGKPLFVLWLDAHTDYHTPQTTDSGNLHGTPMGYLAGRDERAALQDTDVTYIDMRAIDENGIAGPLNTFLDKVHAADGMLHVSLDVDFLDPSVAPAVGTTVPGGATVREAHLVMEMLHDSGLMTSLDLVELNPFLDERGRTAQLMVELTASALGRRIFDRPTRAFS